MMFLKCAIGGLLATALLMPSLAEARSKPALRPVPGYTSITDLTDPVLAALAARARGRSVLVVFDIDNTLLTLSQDLGGDIWFNWKRSLDDSDAVFDKLLTDNSFFLQASTMRPTQPDAAALVKRLQAAGIPVYALTARGSHLRGVTESALKDNGIDLSHAPECGPPLCRRRGALRDREIRYAARWVGLPLPSTPYRDVTVSDGVMLVSGQDKGIMLNLLLRSLPQTYSDVYFIDDTFYNIKNVQAAAPRMTSRVHPYSYERYWADSADFMKSTERQAKADAELEEVRASLCAVVQAHICPPQ